MAQINSCRNQRSRCKVHGEVHGYWQCMVIDLSTIYEGGDVVASYFDCQVVVALGLGTFRIT